jgi:flagellar hook-length control protein FliK
MDQAIQTAAVANVENKTFHPADLLKINSGAETRGGKINDQSDRQETDSTVQAPFYQLLNQQIRQIDKKEETSSDPASTKKIFNSGLHNSAQQNELIMMQSGNSAAGKSVTNGRVGTEDGSLADALVSKNQNDKARGLAEEETNKSGDRKKQIVASAGLASGPENGGIEISADTDFVSSTRQTMDVQAGTGEKIAEALRKNHNNPVAGQTLETINGNSGINKNGSTSTRNLSEGESEDPGKAIPAGGTGELKLGNDNTTVRINADSIAIRPDMKEQPTAKHDSGKEDDSTGLALAMSAGNMKKANATGEAHPSGVELQRIKIPNFPWNESTADKAKVQVSVLGQEMSADKNATKINDSSVTTLRTTLSKEAARNNSNMFNGAIDSKIPEKTNSDTDSSLSSINEAKASWAIKESSESKTVTPDIHSLSGETASTARTEIVQALWTQVNDKSKNDLKTKSTPSGKMEEDLSFDSISTSSGTAVKAEKVTDVNPTVIIEQVATEIKENSSTDGSRIKIVLNPPSLGELSMDVIVRNNKVEVVLTANNKDVQQALNGNLDQLKSTLLNQGLTVERLDVLMHDKHDEFYRPFGNQSYYQDRSGHGGREGRQQRDEEPSSAAPVIGKAVGITKVSTSVDKISLFA